MEPAAAVFVRPGVRLAASALRRSARRGPRTETACGRLRGGAAGARRRSAGRRRRRTRCSGQPLCDGGGGTTGGTLAKHERYSNRSVTIIAAAASRSAATTGPNAASSARPARSVAAPVAGIFRRCGGPRKSRRSSARYWPQRRTACGSNGMIATGSSSSALAKSAALISGRFGTPT